MIPRRDGILIFLKKEGYDGPELGLGILISYSDTSDININGLQYTGRNERYMPLTFIIFIRLSSTCTVYGMCTSSHYLHYLYCTM